MPLAWLILVQGSRSFRYSICSKTSAIGKPDPHGYTASVRFTDKEIK